MSLIAPAISEVYLLQYLVNMVAPTHPVLRLYTNNYTPNDDATLTTLTEASQAGYAPITLVGSSWTTTLTGGVGTAVYSEQTFSFTTGVNVYGYFVTDTTGAKLLWLERFSGAPFTLPSGGGSISCASRISCE